MAGARSDALACTVYVGGLPPGTTPAALANLFKSVKHSIVVRSFGFVTFEDAAHAAEAAERTDLLIDGHPVHAALSHTRYRRDAAAQRPERKRAGGSGAVFVKFPSDRKHQPGSVVQKQLAAACAAHTTTPPRVMLPRKGGGGDQHRGYAFVECAGAADAASLIAALSQSSEWHAEMVKRKRGGRGRGGGGSSQGRAADEGDEFYEDDFESDESEDEAIDRLRGRLGGMGMSRAFDDDDAADGFDDGAAGARDDACVEAMAAFVTESREWALSVQGFLLEHCRVFEDTEENKLEWTELHRTLTSMMEELLEAELSKLGVAVEDFVARLQASDSKASADLLETVLAMDDVCIAPSHPRPRSHRRPRALTSPLTLTTPDRSLSRALRRSSLTPSSG